MVSANIFNLKKGITLVEIVVVVFIIGVMLLVFVADFPKIKRQFALSRATYKFAQDLRRVQDMASSGSKIIKNSADLELNVKGYGIFINKGFDNKKYILYADVAKNAEDEGDKQYQAGALFLEESYCQNIREQSDCIIEIIDLKKDAPEVVIKEITRTNNSDYVSINFNPPNPTTSILPDLAGGADKAGIVFDLESNLTNSINKKTERTVYIWKSGLIEAK